MIKYGTLITITNPPAGVTADDLLAGAMSTVDALTELTASRANRYTITKAGAVLVEVRYEGLNDNEAWSTAHAAARSIAAASDVTVFEVTGPKGARRARIVTRVHVAEVTA